MPKRILLSLLSALLLAALCLTAYGSSEREQDGLNGPVRRVRTETAKLSNKNGKLVEGARATLEVAAYDIKGAKIENAYYPIPGAAATGKEVYKYDDKGNIIEMTLQDEKGTLLSKETYAYEFDQFGNWTKMTTSVAVIENGKITFEPTEVTYRTISYYLDEATLAKMSQPSAPANAPANANANTPAPVAANAPSSNNAASGNTVAATQPGVNAPSKQPAQVAANNKPAPTVEQPKVSAPQSTAAPSSNSSASVVKTSAPVNDRPVEAKPLDETASKPVVKPLLRPVSGGVLNGKALSLPKPAYPLTARSARLTGVVVVEVVIDITGKVISAKAVSGPVLLQQAAVAAAYQAKFSPTILSDQPVKVVGTINYNFAIAQ